MIALLTDFGRTDGYVGTMKGVIASICPEARVIDLSHDIPPQQVEAAAFVLWNSYSYFPIGTIFVGVVDPGVGSERDILAVQTERYTFLAPDNGLLDYVLSELRVRQILKVENPSLSLPHISQTFHGRDIFAPTAAHLENGFLFTQLGPVARYTIPENPFVELDKKEGHKGKVIYIDRFGNLITNIKPLTKDQRLRVLISGVEVEGLAASYSEVDPGEAIALMGSHGLLEVAIRNGNAAESLRAGIAAEVAVE